MVKIRLIFNIKSRNSFKLAQAGLILREITNASKIKSAQINLDPPVCGLKLHYLGTMSIFWKLTARNWPSGSKVRAV